MKTAIINFKTDEATKLKAQQVASTLGIPLSNLLNAYFVRVGQYRQRTFHYQRASDTYQYDSIDICFTYI